MLRDDQHIVSRTDLAGRIVYVNADFIEISGYSEAELIGVTHRIIRHPDMPAAVFADLWADLKAERPWVGMIQNRCRNGDAYWVLARVSPVWEQGKVVGYLSFRRKANEREIAQARVTYAALREGRLSGAAFRHGRVVSESWWARLVGVFERLSIIHRFVLLALLAAALVLGAAAAYFSNDLKRLLDDEASVTLGYDVGLVASSLITHIEAARGEAVDHGKIFGARVRRMLEQETADPFAAIERIESEEAGANTRRLNGLMQGLGSVGALFIRTPAGYRRVLSSLRDVRGEPVPDSFLSAKPEVFASLDAGTAFVGYERLFDRHYLTHYQPILDVGGRVVGATFTGVDLDQRLENFKRQIRHQKIGQSGYYYVIDSDTGELILHPFREGLRVQEASFLNGRDIVAEMLALREGLIRYPWFNPGANETQPREKVVAFTVLSEPRWIVGGGTYVEEFTRLSTLVASYVLSAGLVMLAVVLAIILWLLRRLVFKPLDSQLLPAFRAIASGRYSTQLDIQGESEIAHVIQGLECLQIRLAFDAEQSRGLAVAREAARQAAEDLSRERASFLANMSHEIRTPMNAVIGFAHLLARSNLGKREHDYVRRIEHAGKLLLGVVNDILDFSKIDAGKLHLESVFFQLDDVLDNVSSLVRERAQEKGLSLEYVVDADVPASFEGDALRLSQVLINLIGNAIKFTEAGSVTVYIAVLSVVGREVRLSFRIEDTGIGMSQEETEKLFRAFTQADTTITRRFGGTGLGLAISRRLVEMMGGRIAVSSDPGSGSVFSFDVLLKLADAEQSLPVPARHRVLVVDDNALSRMVLARLLEKIGCQVEMADSGLEALALMQDRAATPFSCVLLDLNMPEMDGVTLAKLIRREFGQTARLVLVTAAKVFDDEQAIDLDDFDGVMEKPVTLAGITEVFAQLDANGAQRPDGARQEAGSATLSGLRVLVAEDVPTNQMIIREMLESFGASVAIVGNGSLALDYLAANPDRVDLILMDLQMPVMDGLEATRRIRAGALQPDIPIIALTAHALAEERIRTKAAGMNDFVTKPIEPAQLVGVLQRWRGRSGRLVEAVPTRVAAAEAVTETPADFPAIDGIDVQLGLGYVRQRAALYERVLRDFHARYADEAAHIRAALAAGRRAEAERRAHSLKGLGATIGATELSTLARELEQCLKGDADCQACLDRLADELARITGGIARALAIA